MPRACSSEGSGGVALSRMAVRQNSVTVTSSVSAAAFTSSYCSGYSPKLSCFLLGCFLPFYGNRKSVHKRFTRWTQSGVWEPCPAPVATSHQMWYVMQNQQPPDVVQSRRPGVCTAWPPLIPLQEMLQWRLTPLYPVPGAPHRGATPFPHTPARRGDHSAPAAPGPIIQGTPAHPSPTAPHATHHDLAA